MNPILVVGASVGGSTAANTLAKAGIPVVMLEKDLSWVKPCGGALPPVAFTEFDIPERLISRKVRKAWIHSPTERIVEIEVAGLQSGRDEYVAMACREELDPWLRNRAVDNGAELIEGKLIALSVDDEGVTATYRPKDSIETVELRASAVIGADGAYSTTAKLLGLERVPYCVAIQERFHVPDHKLGHWSDTADLYLGETVSPDLYAWAFPKADHVAVGCGAGPGKTKQMRQLLENLKGRIADKLDGCEMMMEEAHALPIHPRKQIAFDRVMLVGDAAGLVVGTSGEGIYWAMKSAQIAAEVLVKTLPDTSEDALKLYQKRWWKEYRTMYTFLHWLQRWGYGNEKQKEVFTDMCRNIDVQKLTFESYMYKNMTPVPWVAQLKMTADIVVSQARHYIGVGS